MHHHNRDTNNQNDCGADSYYPIHRLPRAASLHEFAIAPSGRNYSIKGSD